MELIRPKILAEDEDMLESLGLTKYEAKAYLSLLSHGITDARTICDSSGVPSSKIYNIMNKFKLLGLIEIQATKPAKFRALDPKTSLRKLVKNKESDILKLKEDLPLMENHLTSLYSVNEKTDKTFFNMEFGMRNFIQKHVLKLSEAKSEICSYVEPGCIRGMKSYGMDVKNKIIHNIAKNDVKARFLLGTLDKNLIEYFASIFSIPEVDIRITKHIHSPFHVLDNESTITVIDSPLVEDGRIASVHTINNELTKNLKKGFDSLWSKASPLKKSKQKNQ